MIRAVKIGDKNGFLITKAGLALGAGSLGAVIMGLVVGWIALNNTHSLANESHELSNYQKKQIAEAREANCKLKLYDILSGKAGTLLFKKSHVLNKFFEAGITHTLEVVESIPSEKNCTGIFAEPKGKAKKQTGGLTPSDIRYANEVLGEILEEPREFQKRNEAKIKKKIERKNKTTASPHKKKNFPVKKKKENSSSETITTPPTPINISSPIQTAPAPAAAESSKHENHEEKKEEQQEKKTEDKNSKNCILEVNALGKELKVCS